MTAVKPEMSALAAERALSATDGVSDASVRAQYTELEQAALKRLFDNEALASVPMLPVCFIDRSANVDPTAKVHGFAVVQARATIGARCVLWNGARVLPDAVLARDVMIGGGTEIGMGSTVGEGSRIQANCFFPAHSEIGAHVFVGPGVVCTDDRYPYVHSPDDPPYTAEPPIIEDDVAIGAGAVLRPGVRIGRGARVAAGAVVTRDVPGFLMAIGLPATHSALPEGWDTRVARCGDLCPTEEDALAGIMLVAPSGT